MTLCRTCDRLYRNKGCFSYVDECHFKVDVFQKTTVDNEFACGDNTNPFVLNLIMPYQQ